MDYFWIIFGLFMDYFWIISGLFFNDPFRKVIIVSLHIGQRGHSVTGTHFLQHFLKAIVELKQPPKSW